jgi:hypothetical protein
MENVTLLDAMVIEAAWWALERYAGPGARFDPRWLSAVAVLRDAGWPA